MATKFEAAALQFAAAVRDILKRSPQGLTSSEIRGLNEGIAATEAAAGPAGAAHRPGKIAA